MPLHVALFPGTRLPLRIFEPRYRALLTDVLADDERFGIAAIVHGMEAGGPAEVYPVGTRALIQGLVRRDDGGADIVVLGTDRFRIEHRLPDDPYPRAAATLLPEEAGPGAAAALADARAAVGRYRAVLARSEPRRRPGDPAGSGGGVLRPGVGPPAGHGRPPAFPRCARRRRAPAHGRRGFARGDLASRPDRPSGGPDALFVFTELGTRAPIEPIGAVRSQPLDRRPRPCFHNTRYEHGGMTMARRTISIPDDLAERIDALARRERRSFSATITSLIETVLNRSRPQLRSIGAGESGLPDLGRNTEKYLREIVARAKR